MDTLSVPEYEQDESVVERKACTRKCADALLLNHGVSNVDYATERSRPASLSELSLARGSRRRKTWPSCESTRCTQLRQRLAVASSRGEPSLLFVQWRITS